MTEKCKNCGKEMVLDKEWEEDGFRYYRYLCQDYDKDEDWCETTKTIMVCDHCEDETVIWDEE